MLTCLDRPNASQIIRDLNDQWRCQRRGRGTLQFSAGIEGRGELFKARVEQAIREFDAFNPTVDPLGEHTFGFVEVDGEKVLWRIDYYDADNRYLSEDPSDARVTTRRLRAKLASEQ